MAGSPAIDVGLAQPQYADGDGAMQNGAPMLEPTPPIGLEPRYVVGAAIDLGAFEYGNMPAAGDDAHGFDDDGGMTSGGGKSGGCCEVDGGAAASSWFLIAIVAGRLARRRKPRR
jgi:MYXO-CTERM domain-containing protein